MGKIQRLDNPHQAGVSRAGAETEREDLIAKDTTVRSLLIINSYVIMKTMR